MLALVIIIIVVVFCLYEIVCVSAKSFKVQKRIQVTSLWEWAARNEPGYVQTVQAEKIIQPLFYGVSWSVPNGLVKRNLMERASCDTDTQAVRHMMERHTHTLNRHTAER